MGYKNLKMEITLEEIIKMENRMDMESITGFVEQPIKENFYKVLDRVKEFG